MIKHYKNHRIGIKLVFLLNLIIRTPKKSSSSPILSRQKIFYAPEHFVSYSYIKMDRTTLIYTNHSSFPQDIKSLYLHLRIAFFIYLRNVLIESHNKLYIEGQSQESRFGTKKPNPKKTPQKPPQSRGFHAFDYYQD